MELRGRNEIQGKENQRVKLTMGEMLDENREFTQKNMVSYKPVKEFGRTAEIMLMTGMGEKIPGGKQRTPMQEVVFFCSGGEHSYKT